MQYAAGVEVLEPASLRERLKESAQQMLAKYDQGAEKNTGADE